MIEKDYQLISCLKERFIKIGFSVTKSQLLRAGLNALEKMSDKELTKIFQDLDNVKTGRPKK